LINSISALGNLALYVKLDYYGLNENIFSHLDQCYSRLLSKKFLIMKENDKEEAQEFNKIIRERMFFPGSIKTGGII